MNSSKYELTALPGSSGDTAANYDVSCSDQYLGRLYLLPADDPRLTSRGIEKKWFLTHQKGDFLVSGYINSSGEWSLSRPMSVEPSFDYATQFEVFNKIFSPDYIQEVQALRESHLVDLPINGLVHDVLRNDNSGNGDSGEGKLRNEVQQVDRTALGLNIHNLEFLRELAMREQLEEEVSQPAELDKEALAKNTDLGKDNNSTLLVPIDDESRRARIESDLVNLIIENHKRHQLPSFVVEPEGMVTVDPNQDSFVLHSLVDGHVVLAATLAGEILEQLKPNDARLFNQRDAIEAELLQLDSEQEELADEVAADTFAQHVTEHSEQPGRIAQVEVRDESKNKKSRGIELQ